MIQDSSDIPASFHRGIWREGLAAAWDEGYSRRELCRRFHISQATLRGWIREELLKDGAEGRVPERSVRALLGQHPELINWDRLDPEARQWALELSAKDEEAEPDDTGTIVKPSSAKQLSASAQTEEIPEAGCASTAHHTETSSL